MRPRLARSRTSRALRAAKTTPSTPASAPASITQENGGNNISPGGVGQSLNSCLIANLFSGSHEFMDMNVFHTEDELRKQADTFTGKVNIWGVTHSPPRTRKISLSWFFWVESGRPCVPQVMSGDPAAARLPKAILMKMVTFSGWKRFEMNETLKFHGVTEMTFPSITRRSLVSAQRLASLRQKTERHVGGRRGQRSHQGGHGRGLRAPCGGRGPRPGRRRSRGRRSARRGRGGDRGGEAGTWLAAGRCHVSLVKRRLERGWDFCSEYRVSRLHQDV